jgi:type VI secretion system VgrG family protein
MQTYVERKHFSFFSKALSEDTFGVVKFSGRQAISQPYEFTITLSAHDSDIDLKGVLRNPATLIILGGAGVIPISGVLRSFEQLHEANQRVFYRAVLVPKLWYLSLYRENRLFLNKSVPQILEEVLKQSGLTSADYELKLTRSYPAWEYVCQYAESNLDFISRWMEREGIYYFFRQTPNGEKLVITDNLSVHENIAGESTLSYTPAAGLMPEHEEIVTGFVCQQNVLPKKVILKDYNYRKPSLDVRAEAEIDANGREEVYIYGEHFKDPSQGKELASIRAGEFLCRETMYYGQATSPQLAPGFLFELARHYRGSYNCKYLVTEVEHHGLETGVLLAGLGDEEAGAQPGYSNTFVCIPSSVQFRPERKTPRPRINGTMNAVVDSAGDGSTAELDNQGRYKVILPFDLSGRSGGKASRWVRMAQPYSGSDYGMHFPLHKGAEVLLTFIDGDIDRPIISGAVPNPNTQSPVTNANQTKSVIRDKFGNEIIMDATPGDEHIRLYSPHHKTKLELGKSGHFFTESDHSTAYLGNEYDWGVGGKYSFFFGPSAQLNSGLLTAITIALNNNVNFGGTHQIDVGYNLGYSAGPRFQIAGDVSSVSKTHNVVSAKEILCLIGGAAMQPEPGRPDNTSIICADEEKIRLSVGRKKQAIEPSLDKGDKGLLAAITAVSLLSALLATDPAHGTKRKNLVISSAVFLGLSAALAGGFGYKRYRADESSEKVKAIAEERNPAAKIEIKREGDININSNGKQVVPEYKNRIVLSTGKEGDPNQTGTTLALVGNVLRMESKSHGKVESTMDVRTHPSGLTTFRIFGKGQVRIETEQSGVSLTKNGFAPLDGTNLLWPNLHVKSH